MAATLETRFRAKTVAPGLTVDDIQKSITFFENLGFGVGQRWEADGVLHGVLMSAGDGSFFLFQDDWQKGRDRQKGTAMRFYISTTQDIDQVAADAKKAGVRLDAEPHDTDWGSRAFEVTEPSGFKITIASPW
jgi:uncharacterized glyoxalase superfamily protein PhnB